MDWRRQRVLHGLALTLMVVFVALALHAIVTSDRDGLTHTWRLVETAFVALVVWATRSPGDAAGSDTSSSASRGRSSTPGG